MKSMQLVLSGYIIAIGLFGLIYKPYYEADIRVNLRKVSIYQGWGMLIFGLYLLILSIVVRLLSFPLDAWIIGIIVGIIPFAIIMTRLKKACYIQDDSEYLTFNIGIQEHKYQVFAYVFIGLLIGLIVFSVAILMIRPKIEIAENKLKVGGEFAFEYPISEIIQLDTFPGYPDVKYNNGGVEMAGIYQGSFIFKDSVKGGRLYLKKGICPYIFVRFRNDDLVYFNLQSSIETIRFYKELQLRTQNNRLYQRKRL